MEESPKFRVTGSIICVFSLIYYVFEITNQLKNWYSYGSIATLTTCSEVFGLELWLLTQSFIWFLSILIILIVLLFPVYLSLMLCFMYLIGPLFFMWTLFAIVMQATFITCCFEEADKCENFYPYKRSNNFTMLLIVSLLFSVSISVFLMSILVNVLLQYARNSNNQYQTL